MRIIAQAMVFVIFLNFWDPLPVVAQELFLPAPGKRVELSPTFSPAVLKGIKLDPKDPLSFHFYVDRGDVPTRGHDEIVSPSTLPSDVAMKAKATQRNKADEEQELKQETSKLIKYFLASLTVPEEDLWVNLSPYEKNRIVPKEFGQTQMGRDLLAQDYLLKQITASLIYPEGELGKKFWKEIYAKAQAQFGTTNIPVNTFNKVWIVPEKAVVYENEGTAFVLESKLKVMLEEDYLAKEKNLQPTMGHVNGDSPLVNNDRGTVPINVSPSRLPSERTMEGENDPEETTNRLSSQILREIVIPALEKEVNEGKNFSQLRQIFYSLILATWYKKKIKDSILAKVYANQNKIEGLKPTRRHDFSRVPKQVAKQESNEGESDPEETTNVQAIYKQYLQAFKKGVYNYIKEESDLTNQTTPRKYFSGGIGAFQISQAYQRVDRSQITNSQLAGLQADRMMEAQVDIQLDGARKDQRLKSEALSIAQSVIQAHQEWVVDGVLHKNSIESSVTEAVLQIPNIFTLMLITMLESYPYSKEDNDRARQQVKDFEDFLNAYIDGNLEEALQIAKKKQGDNPPKDWVEISSPLWKKRKDEFKEAYRKLRDVYFKQAVRLNEILDLLEQSFDSNTGVSQKDGMINSQSSAQDQMMETEDEIITLAQRAISLYKESISAKIMEDEHILSNYQGFQFQFLTNIENLKEAIKAYIGLFGKESLEELIRRVSFLIGSTTPTILYKHQDIYRRLKLLTVIGQNVQGVLFLASSLDNSEKQDVLSNISNSSDYLDRFENLVSYGDDLQNIQRIFFFAYGLDMKSWFSKHGYAKCSKALLLLLENKESWEDLQAHSSTMAGDVWLAVLWMDPEQWVEIMNHVSIFDTEPNELMEDFTFDQHEPRWINKYWHSLGANPRPIELALWVAAYEVVKHPIQRNSMVDFHEQQHRKNNNYLSHKRRYLALVDSIKLKSRVSDGMMDSTIENQFFENLKGLFLDVSDGLNRSGSCLQCAMAVAEIALKNNIPADIFLDESASHFYTVLYSPSKELYVVDVLPIGINIRDKQRIVAPLKEFAHVYKGRKESFQTLLNQLSDRLGHEKILLLGFLYEDAWKSQSDSSTKDEMMGELPSKGVEVLKFMHIGMNGSSGQVGSQVFKHFKALGGRLRAAFFPNAPSQSSIQGEGLDIQTGNILDPDHNRQMLRDLDGFVHLAAIPIHYADKSKAPMIFAVDVLGSTSVALAAHEEMQARRKKSDSQKLRMIMTSSVSSVWMAKTIEYLASKKESKRTAQELNEWLANAEEEFLTYVKQRHAGHLGLKEPVEFVSEYILKGEGEFGGRKTLSEIVEGLKGFDYYALSKLLTDRILNRMVQQGLVENMIVIQPVSLLGQGLQSKDDPGFTSKMVRALYEGRPQELWDSRHLYYLPVEALINIIDGLLLAPEDKIGGKIKTVQLPGNKISQTEAFNQYILPITKRKLQKLGYDVSRLEQLITVVPNPFPIEAEIRQLDVDHIDPLVQETHQVGSGVLQGLFEKVIQDIIESLELETRRDAALVANVTTQAREGGINLNPAQMDLQAVGKLGTASYDLSDEKLGTVPNFDTAQITGVHFTIRSLVPVTDLPQLLELN